MINYYKSKPKPNKSEPKSEFNLRVLEPTGRHWTYEMFALSFGDTLIVKAECDPDVMAEFLPFENFWKPRDRCEFDTFMREYELWLSPLNAIYVADFLRLLKPYQYECDLQRKLFEAWKGWEVELKIVRGARVIRNQLGRRTPNVVTQLSDGFHAQSLVLIERMGKVREACDGDDDDDSEDDVPF